MLVFVDESGDPGRKTDQGSSPFFFIATVVFPDRLIAQECDDCITKLRTELRYGARREFHFNSDHDRVREAFLKCVAKFNFWYSVMALNKDNLTSPGFQYKDSLYKCTVKWAFENIFNELDDAIIVFDRCGGREFTNSLKNYLRKAMNQKAGNADHGRIKKMRCDDSAGNNLLQMADMICGAVARCYSSKSMPDKMRFRNLIRMREKRVSIWPTSA